VRMRGDGAAVCAGNRLRRQDVSRRLAIAIGGHKSIET
jgi:hypothetical protein